MQSFNFHAHAYSRAILLASIFALGGCATTGRTTLEDPWQKANRGVYRFNDSLDRYALKPAAKGYKAVTPTWMRTSFSNFFANLGYPVTMVNQLLQGKPKLFAQDTGRFITNTVVGIGGFLDVADRMGMPAHDEDFGQTLAVWGVPSGPYVTLPFFGPSTARDAPARIPDYFLSIFRYVDVPAAAELGAEVLEVIDDRSELLSSEGTLDAAYDRYGVMRDAWLQRREYLIFDGEPPEEALELDEELMEENPIDTPEEPAIDENAATEAPEAVAVP